PAVSRGHTHAVGTGRHTLDRAGVTGEGAHLAACSYFPGLEESLTVGCDQVVAIGAEGQIGNMAGPSCEDREGADFLAGGDVVQPGRAVLAARCQGAAVRAEPK